MCYENRGPAYRIHTRRLVIRCWNPEDAPLLKAAIDENVEYLTPWLPWASQEPEPLDKKVARLRYFRGRFDRDEDYVYGIFNRTETRVLGGTGLHTRLGKGAREIGYWIHQAFANQGLATEAASALIRVAFEIDGVDRVEIHCAPDNVRSAAVPRKLSFIHEATLRRRLPWPGRKPRDTMIWTLLVEEYPGSPAAAVEIDAFDALGRRIL